MVQAAKIGTGGGSTRDRILAAAAALALERGPGNISIEAVATEAGLSKGGVLYHFHTKADLLSALVTSHIEAGKECVARCIARRTGANMLAAALIDAHKVMMASPKPAPSGILAAIAEHPDLLEPLRAHHSEMLRRLHDESADPDIATLTYLALEGLKALHIFGVAPLDEAQCEALFSRMMAQLGETPQPA